MPERPAIDKAAELARLRAIGLSDRDFTRLSAMQIPGEVLAGEQPISGAMAMEPLAEGVGPIDEEKRIVSLSFSNEDPFNRWFGKVKLDHSPGCARLERLNNGAPFLLHHDQWNPLCHVGAVVKGSARIEADRVGRADVRLEGDTNEFAVMALSGMKDGIRTKISMLVQFHKLVLLEESDDGPSYYLCPDWEAYEISLLPVAAIDTIGVGLSYTGLASQSTPDGMPAAAATPAGKGIDMTKPIETPSAPAAELAAVPAAVAPAVTVSAARPENDAQRICQLGAKYKQEALALKAIAEGKDCDAFKDDLMAALASKPISVVSSPPAEVGLTDRQIQDFRIMRLASYMVTPNFDTQRSAGFELEACKEAAKLAGRDGQDKGYTLPREVFRVTRQAAAQAMLNSIADMELRKEFMQRLAVSSVTGGAGGYLVSQQVGTLVELLRELTVLGEVGVTYLGDLRGDFSFPKLTGGLTYGWLGDEEDGTESTATFVEHELHPRTAYGLGKITRKMLLQSSYDVEMLLRGDIFSGIGNCIQQGVFTGLGGLKKLLGVYKWSGVGEIVIGTDGGAMTRDHLVKMETQISTALKGNYAGNIKFITNGKVRGQLRLTAESATMAAAGWLWQHVPGRPGVGELLGYPAYVTGDMPNNLTKGSGTNLSAIYGGVWEHMIIGLWGPLQIDLDDSLYFKQGGKAIRGLADVDMGLRHAGAFSSCREVATTSVN